MSKQQQRQVWQRVYHTGHRVPPLPKQHLLQCRRRLEQNLRFYEGQSNHPIYGPAFDQLARQTEEHIQMLRQMMDT